MDRAFLVIGQLKLADNTASGNLHDDSLGRLSVLNEHHMRAPDGLSGVNLRSLRRLIAPNGLSVLVNFGHAILMGHEHVAVGHQHSIADFATLQLVLIGPAHLSVLYDEHASLLALPGIEEVMT